MKAGWEVKPLGKVCEKITDGSHNPPKGVEYSDFFMLSSKNVWDDKIIFDKPRFLTEDHFWDENKRTDVSAGNVLLTIVGTIGRCAVVSESDRKFTLQRSVAVLKPLADHIDSRFLMYALQSMLEHLVDGSQGAAQKGIYLKALRVLPIPIPPLEEQKRIVAVLDAAFEGLTRAKENAETNLQNARELFESYLASSMTSAVVKFGTREVSEYMESIVDCVNKTAPKSESETPFKMVRTSNIRNGQLDLSSANFVSNETYEAWTRRQVPRRGDVLLTREAPMGEAAMVDTDDKIFLGQRVVSYRADQSLMASEFLLYSFMSKLLKDQFIALGSGSTVQHIRVPHTKTLQVPSVPITEQRKLVEALGNLRAKAQFLEDRYRSKLTDIADLRQSLLQKAFAGELT